MTDNKFDRDDCKKNETRILSAFFAYKKSTKAGFSFLALKKPSNFYSMQLYKHLS